jgi:hypothetical protein
LGDAWFWIGEPCSGSASRRRVAVVRALADDPHPIAVAAAIEGAIGGLARFGQCG